MLRSTIDPKHTYSHACATIAMCDAFAASKHLPWRKSGEQAIAYVHATKNPYKAWRYGKQPGDNDASVTGWMLMALRSARDAGIPINPIFVHDGLGVLDSMTDETTGRTGYVRKGDPPVHAQPVESRISPWGESPTAIAVWARFESGAADSPLTKLGQTLLEKKPPVWDEAKRTIDMDYWYWGSVAAFQAGGQLWDVWRRELLNVARAHQVEDGCAAGSWDPKVPWGDEGGRVYATAMMTLCLEVPFRRRAPLPKDLEGWTAEARRKHAFAFVEYAKAELTTHIFRLMTIWNDANDARPMLEEAIKANLQNELMRKELEEALDAVSQKADEVVRASEKCRQQFLRLEALLKNRSTSPTTEELDKAIDEAHAFLVQTERHGRSTTMKSVEEWMKKAAESRKGKPRSIGLAPHSRE